MFGFKKKITSLLIRHNIIDKNQLKILSKDPFNKKLQNKIERQKFFYNAFYILKTNGISGDYAEFGCYGGMTFNLAYKEILRHGNACKLWAFDSFKGLPKPKGTSDFHPCWNENDMSMSLEEFKKICFENNIPNNKYKIVSGYYSDTLDKKLWKDKKLDISLAYIDCDLYSSTVDVLEFLAPKLKHGMIIAFDDYFMYTENQVSGNRKAMIEYFNTNKQFQLLPYIQFSHVGQSFIVEDQKNLLLETS